MKEIKYRAFDKIMEKMYEVGCIDFAKGLVQLTEVIDGKHYGRGLIDIECVALLQYTGIKDKNGKEIVHKDIVKSDDDCIYTVEWHNEYAMFYYKDEYNCEEYDKSMDTEGFEVIGNVYENSDLLKRGYEND